MLSFFVFLFGLSIGSFLNVVIYRVPQGKSIVSPPSACPNCGTRIKSWQNIPVVSFLVLRGRCAVCKAPISWRYPFVELLTGILFWALFYRFGLSWELLAWAIACASLIVITFIDLDYQIIPDQFLITTLLAAVILLVLKHRSWDGVWGALGLGLGFYLIRAVGSILLRKESMGFGDVKYAAVLGLLLGWKAGLVAVMLAFFSAAIFSLGLMTVNRAEWGQRIPFGPFLSLGALLALFWGQSIINWYLGLLS